jgi:hypothetical protein
MKKLFTVLFMLVFASSAVQAQTTKWAENIAPILYKNCAKCHNPNGVAPFSLITYSDAYNARIGVRAAVISRQMPPWTPDPKYTRFAHERALTQSDIDEIRNWVDGGAPQGNPALAPTPPVFPRNGEITTPDLVLQIPTYTVNTTQDLYRNFAIPSNLIADRTIVELEVVPGNRQIVHHVLAFRDSSARVLQLDAADPLPGYTNFGGTGTNSSELVMGWVPGQGKIKYPAGMGMKLPRNTNLVLQIHYPGGISNQRDSTKIVFKFAPTTTTLRELRVQPLLDHVSTLVNGPLVITANTTKSFTSALRTPVGVDGTILSIAPHMHLIGRRMKVYGIKPNGDTLRLINIPEWDFNWQGSYDFPKLLKVPGGTQLKAEAFYDNTAANPFNPSNPPKLVRLGEATTDEMLLVYFTFTAYQPGDENIVIDSTVLSTKIQEANLPNERQRLALKCFPNPLLGKLNVEVSALKADYYDLEMFDIKGDLVKRLATQEWLKEGLNSLSFDTHDLPSGAFFVKISSNNFYGIEQVIKVE